MKIETTQKYKESLLEVYNLMNKGESTLTEKEKKEIITLSQAVEVYEDTVLNAIPVELTISNLIEQKLKEKNMTQKAFATLVGMGTAKVSQILNGKRKPDIEFIKAIRNSLEIDGNQLLDLV